VKPLIPYLTAHGVDLFIAISGLVAGLIYTLRPDWVGNYRPDRDRNKFRWFGVIFLVAGTGLLIFMILGYLNSN
jgi:hypothetical protein